MPVEGPRREIINETMVFGHIPYPVTCISVGNPHLVILMDEISKDLVCRIGKYSETAKQFPERSIPRSSRCWTALIYRQKFMKEVQVIHWHPEAAAVQQLRQLTDWDLQIRNDRADAGRYHGSRDPGRRGDLSYRRCRLCGKHQPGKLFYRTVEAGIG